MKATRAEPALPLPFSKPIRTPTRFPAPRYHADEDLRSEIQKDVDRTMPEYMFFNQEQPAGRTHAAAIARVLFVYAKLNPGIRYVQVRV
jgi:hypothetical protein